MLRVLVSLFLFAGAVVTAAPVSTPLGLTRVFIPANGYDDNDTVEAVLTGELPNPCFSLNEPVVERLGDARFRLSVSAIVRRTGACADGSSNDDPVPFQLTAPLGTLSAGSYTIEYTNERGARAERVFRVTVASSEEVDESNYAVVRGVMVEDVQTVGKPVEVIIQGTVTRSCDRLPADFVVRREGDVVLILPVLETDANATCRKRVRSFRKTVTLDNLPPGQYLLHVRSRSGRALYQTFDVWQM